MEVLLCASPHPGEGDAFEVSHYLEKVQVEVFVEQGPDCWAKAEEEAKAKLVDIARSMGGNAVLAPERTVDPFAHHPETNRPGLRLHATGTAARLVALRV